MSEAVSAMNKAAFDGLCQVQEIGLQGMITLRGDLKNDAIARAAADFAGVGMPGQRQIAISGDRAIAWMSPDEALLLCSYSEVGDGLAALETALADEHALAVDVSDARASFVLTGQLCREVIAKLAPVDMSPAAFRPGMIRRTRLAQVAAAVWLRDGDSAQIVCFRSVAPYVFGLLCNAASPGTEAGFFRTRVAPVS